MAKGKGVELLHIHRAGFHQNAEGKDANIVDLSIPTSEARAFTSWLKAVRDCARGEVCADKVDCTYAKLGPAARRAANFVLKHYGDQELKRGRLKPAP